MVEWDYLKTANKSFKLAKATKSQCALCLHKIHTGKRTTVGSLQSKRVNKLTRYNLFHRYQIIFGLSQRICTRCYELEDHNKILSETAYEYESISTHCFMTELYDLKHKLSYET